MGTQKSRLDETVLLSTQKHMVKLMGKKIITISCFKKFLSGFMTTCIRPQEIDFYSLYQQALRYGTYHMRAAKAQASLC